jgi:hypothetical protein
MFRLPFALLPLLALTACAAANPMRFDDQVAVFHDDLRWGRLPAAETSVDPRMREQFQRRHAAWGRTVQIVDLEIEGTRMQGLVATVRARFLWLRGQDVETRETIVETRWRAGMGRDWILDDEQVVGGDPSLLATR